MWKAEITGPWATGEDGNHAKIGDDHVIVYCQDMGSLSSGEIVPDPNENRFLIRCEADVLAEIEADPQYTVIESEEIDESDSP